MFLLLFSIFKHFTYSITMFESNFRFSLTRLFFFLLLFKCFLNFLSFRFLFFHFLWLMFRLVVHFAYSIAIFKAHFWFIFILFFYIFFFFRDVFFTLLFFNSFLFILLFLHLFLFLVE